MRKMSVKKFVIYTLFCMVVGGFLVLAGCQEPPPPPPPQKIEKETPPPATEQAAGKQEEEEKEPEYTYDPAGRREPFKTLVKEQIPEEPRELITPDPEIQLGPLQKFDVKQLKLTGIILGGLGDYARVVAPDGKPYTLHIGTPVGQHEGEVVSITDNSVVVKEIYRYEGGEVEEVETPLYLKPIEEEEKS